MNCNDYLAMLSTLPVEELEYGSARAHAAECRDCDRVTRVVVERERSMLVAYNDIDSKVAASQVAADAFTLSARRRVARYYKVALGLAAAATVVLMILSRATIRLPDTEAVIAGSSIMPADVEHGPNEMLTEIFDVRCMSQEQAAEMLRTHLQGNARVTFNAGSSPNSLTVQASRAQIDVARDVLDRLGWNNGTCAIPAPAAPPPP